MVLLWEGDEVVDIDCLNGKGGEEQGLNGREEWECILFLNIGRMN